jgi:hypothetical protein
LERALDVASGVVVLLADDSRRERRGGRRQRINGGIDAELG